MMRRIWHRLFGHPQRPMGHKYDVGKVVYFYHCSCESCCHLMTEPITS